MPYIKPEDRPQFRNVLNELPPINTKGELEYCIFVLMVRYMSDKRICYTNLHNTVYAAHHCGDEFRHRFLDKRELSARRENGDIYAQEDVLSVVQLPPGWTCKKCGSWWRDALSICQYCGRSRKSQEGPNSW